MKKVIALAVALTALSCASPCENCLAVAGSYSLTSSACVSGQYDIEISQNGSHVELDWGPTHWVGTLMSDLSIVFDPWRANDEEQHLSGQFTAGQPPAFQGTYETFEYDERRNDMVFSCRSNVSW